MLWVVQNNLYNEEGYIRFTEALQRLGLEYVVVKPVPFTDRFVPADFDSMKQDLDDTPEPEIDASQKVIVCGTITLSRIAKRRGWTPGTYLNENFDYRCWCWGFRSENVLNPNAYIAKVSDRIPNMGDVFVRPLNDTKAFTGTVMTEEQFREWLNTFRKIEEGPVHQGTQILIAEPKKIYSEFRLWIVDNKIVTASQYKLGNRTNYQEIVDGLVIDFGNQMIDLWQPAKAFVLDVADTPDGYKVIEINNINSAGFYAGDAQKIVAALEKMEKE